MILNVISLCNLYGKCGGFFTIVKHSKQCFFSDVLDLGWGKMAIISPLFFSICYHPFGLRCVHMLFQVCRCRLVVQKQRTKLKNFTFLVTKATKQYYTILIENKFDVIMTFGVAPFF